MSAVPDIEVTPVRAELFGPGRRTTTVGLLLLVSMVAFEAMGVGTAMPALVADFGALSLYAWPFMAFMAAGVVGTVLGGRWCDLAGPRIPLVVASLSWSAASGWQGQHPELPRRRLLRIGFGLLAAGTAGLLLVAPSWGTPWLALPLWGIAGVGMGLGYSAVSFLLLAQSGAAEVGVNSSAAQMSDQLATAILISTGGALLALLAVLVGFRCARRDGGRSRRAHR